jgi:hypothetical protein
MPYRNKDRTHHRSNNKLHTFDDISHPFILALTKNNLASLANLQVVSLLHTLAYAWCEGQCNISQK